jgi:hypothetical protein
MAKKAMAVTEIKNQPSIAQTVTTAVHLPKETWVLLRAVAFHRAQDTGGRASVSKLVAELVEQRRRELEREIKKLP